MSVQKDDLYQPCDDCDRLAFEPKPCGTCGPSSRFCASHVTHCATCDEDYCHDHAPAHRAACTQINQRIDA